MECSEPVEKNLVNRTIFEWVTALWNIYINGLKMSFFLCVVFKCQYFWSYSRKTHFSPFIYIFKRAVTHSKIVRLTRFFSTGSEHSNEVFLFFESYHFLKIMKRKCQTTEFRGGHLGFLAAILDWQWGIFNPVFYTWQRSFVQILVILLSIFHRGDNLKEKQAYKTIWALPVKKISFQYLSLTC